MKAVSSVSVPLQSSSMPKPHCFRLKNGLPLIVQPVPDTMMAVCDLMFHVGARNEKANLTGIAHFYEHVRFGPSKNVPSYDLPLQNVGGSSNAYTDQDVTNYWCELPANQLEVAFWLESDRMLSPTYDEDAIEVQRKVVMEEFKQHYLVPPYGDVHHLLMAQAYGKHPYRWPVIGQTLDHIAQCTKEDLVAFGDTFYHPGNAVLVVVGGVSPNHVYTLAEKWFGDIPAKPLLQTKIPQEPWQKHAVVDHVQREVPHNAIYKSFHMPGRTHHDYISLQLINRFFTGGLSSSFRKQLVEKEMIFAEIETYLTESKDPGLFVIEGKLQDGVSLTKAENALQRLIDDVVEKGIPPQDLIKVKRQEKTKYLLSTTDLINHADMLAYASLLSDANLFEHEISRMLQANNASIQATAAQVFRKENSHTLYYEKK